MKHSFLETLMVISSIITRNFFVTRNKQPMTTEPIECVLVEMTFASTPCAFHDNPRQLYENSLRRFAIVAFFDVCDTSCPIGKPFSLLLCDEFLKTYILSMPQLSKYVSNERFRKVLQS